MDRSLEVINYFELKYIPNSNKFCAFLPRKTETKIHNNITNIIDYTYGIKFMSINNSLSSRIHIPYTAEILEQDRIKNTKSKTEILSDDVDNYGNILKKVLSYENDNGNFALDYDIFVLEVDPNLYNGWYACKPLRTTTMTKRGNDPITYSKTTEYEYYKTGINKGFVQYLTEYPEMEKETTKSYFYDSFGNVYLISYSSKDTTVETKTSRSIYDAKGQFIITSINELGHSHKMVVNNIGLITSDIDPNNLITAYEYDGFGQLVKTISPNGNYAEKLVTWTNDPQWVKCLYHIDYVSKGAPKTITYYDEFDRVIRTSVEQRDGKFLHEDKIYHPTNGTLYKVSLPYQGTPPSQYIDEGWTVYNYNIYGGIESIKTNTHSEWYTYNTADRTTSIVKKDLQANPQPVGVSKVLKYNYLGQLQSIEDNLGIVQYEYYGSGLIKDLINIDGTKITNNYDEYNRKASTIDPNSGTITYKYDAFGILRYEEDQSATYAYLYDKLNRIKTITSSNGNVISYTYDAQDKPIGTISEISHSNGISYSYEYDKLARISKQTERIEGKDYTFEYTYNEFGNIATQKYPSGLLIKNVYSDNGFLIQVYKNADVKPLIDIPLDGINEFGQLDNYTLGNGIVVDKFYDQYRKLSGIKYGNILNLEWDFDPLLGNVTSRKDITDPAKPLEELFKYHDQAKTRLNEYQVSNTTAYTVGYNPNGTIDSKSDIGQYNYGLSAHPYAISMVSTNLPILYNKQDIFYTDYNKASLIVKTSGADIIELKLTYGPEMQRKKTELIFNKKVTKTKYFIGNSYEIEYKNNEIRELNYIFGPDGLIGIYTITDKKEEKMYYIHTDHLGSWKSITDESGLVVEKMDYDPWGRRRDPQTWQYTTDREYLFDRGFTGHEMLDEFELINMNGRIYDPLLGTFISADNFVQSPDNSQSFNRYGYCFNNPLVFTDPSGYWSGWDDLIVGAAGFAFGYVSHGIATGDWGWDAVKSGAVYCALFMVSYYSAGTCTQSAASLANNKAILAAKYAGKLLAGNILSKVLPPITIMQNDVYTVSISPNLSFGSGFGIGASLSIDAKHNGYVMGMSIGFTSFGKYAPTGTSFTEKRTNIYFGYVSNTGGFVYGINSFSGGGFDQSTSSCTLLSKIGDQMGSVTYENDWMFGLPGPDGGDRFRSAAIRFQWGNYGLGLNMFTGNPNEQGTLDMNARGAAETSADKLREAYNAGTANSYRMGALYISYDNFKIGSNSEVFRHVFQNLFAHDLLTNCSAKWFEKLDNKLYFYGSYDTRSKYSLW